MAERLQKILAQADLGSRRSCEEIIRQGRVTVNGAVAKIGQSADPDLDEIYVDGNRIRRKRKFTYIALNKPRDVLSDEGDGTGRVTTARQLLPVPGHLFPVGRLDLRSEGLLLFTDDGELANRLTHPRYEHTKEYRVLVEGHPDQRVLDSWRKGVLLDDKMTLPARVEVVQRTPDRTWLRVVLREGRKRQIRRVASLLGHYAVKLVRVRVGPIWLGQLKPGEWRYLSSREIGWLAELVAKSKQAQRRARGKPQKRRRRRR